MTKATRSIAIATSPWVKVAEGFDALPESYQKAMDLRGYNPETGEFAATGATWKEVQAQTGVSENRGSLVEMHLKFGHKPIEGMTDGQIKELIVKLRKEGYSWGQISAQTLISESRVRKAYTERSGVDHQGLRVGHGGRFLQDDPSHYEGEAAKSGWVRVEDPDLAKATVPELIGSAAAGYQREDLEALKMADLRKLFKQSFPEEAAPRKKADIVDLLATD